ncbi:MAG: hypothetical protein VXY10_04765 [Candidatus Thermoplasmatota archaeon]|nr:hypothetical protein [Candidatus Thermoplasmatota archaeon]MEC8708108.1 hypothetical protein [Candidatus Thermoplasmatota archaeon]
MKKSLAVMMVMLLVLSGCLGFGGNDEEDVEENTNLGPDTDGDGLLDIYDSDDDDDRWEDIDELNCMSDPLDATDVPLDFDSDWFCDVRDFDDDNDGFPDTDETLCGTDPLDATSVPSDMDNDGLCDSMDDDIDGDGVANDDDFAPENPDKWQGITGCTDSAAFNHDEAAEADDGSCFTLESAEQAVSAALTGLVKMEITSPDTSGFLSSQSILRVTLVHDGPNNLSSSTFTLFDGDQEVGTATYTFANNGYVQVELNSEQAGQQVAERYLVSSVYEEVYLDGDSDWGMAHCENDGLRWYCLAHEELHYDWYANDEAEEVHNQEELCYNPDTHEVYESTREECEDAGHYWMEDDDHDGQDDHRALKSAPNANSGDLVYHRYACANGEVVKIAAVNNGVDDCGDGSDEAMMQTDGATFTCDDGAVVSFERVNDGEADCPDGSDEYTFIGDYWNCTNGEMIYSMDINNGHVNCQDGSDEPHYDMTPYEVSTYACEDGNTVMLSEVNDGNDDCPDGTDEHPSGEIIMLFEFHCNGDPGDEEETVPINLVNDGNADCPNGEDEVTYDTSGNENSTFTCWDYWGDEAIETIPLSKVNDGQIDCMFHDDESVAASNNWFGFTHDEEDDWSFSGECQVDGEDTGWPWTFVNDGIEDCDDGADEDDGTGTMEWACEDGSIISFALLNNGENDCAGSEDEADIVVEAIFRCGDGETVDFNDVNDGRYDCENESDEPEYELEELTDFTCDDGTLVPLSKVNNRENDCSEGEDEPTYEQTEVSTFECNSGDTVPLSSVNDGQNDCPGGDDEPTYSPVTQTETSTYSCLYSGETIALSSVNNGEEDCDDGTDEPYYYEEETSEFTCNDGYTLPLSYVNDGYEDCMDGSDEPQYVMPEDSNTLMCNDGSTIGIDKFNNGIDDCADGSDEVDLFVCENGWRTILLLQVNDETDHCGDGSDETQIDDVNIVECYGGEDSIKVSQFHDGRFDCESGWDEMQFNSFRDCEWNGEESGWMCTEVHFDPEETWEVSVRKTFGQAERMVLFTTTDNGTTVEAVFDAETYELLTLEVTPAEENHYDTEHMKLTTGVEDPTMASVLIVDQTLDVHAPPFAVYFHGEARHANNKMFTCNDGTTVPFQAVNDHHNDCPDASDEPTYQEESYACTLGNEQIPMSHVNDGQADCADGSDEPVFDESGQDTTYFTCLYSGEEIILSWVNDVYIDCHDQTDEPEGYMTETSSFTCDSGDTVPLSHVNDHHEDCHDGSDELPEAQGHGYGEYDVVVGGAYTWTVGEGDHTLEVVFANCQDFTQTYPYNGVQTTFAPLSYLVPENCGGDVARYSLTDIAAGEVVGLSYAESDGERTLRVETNFTLDGWNAVRLSTPAGEYADENPQVQLPAPGAGFAVLAMLGAALLARRKPE